MPVHKCNDTIFHFILDLRIVVDLMAEAGIYLCIHGMPGLVQPVADLIDSLSVLSYRVLVAADVVDGQISGDLFRPGGAG